MHDVRMWHTGEEEPTDEVRRPKGLDEALDLRHALLRAADDASVAHQIVQFGGDAAVDGRMLPATGVLIAIASHDMMLGELALLGITVGDDDVAGQRPFCKRGCEASRGTVSENLLRTVQKPG
jgi:hypothetical protein